MSVAARREAMIVNEKGLHARASRKFAELAMTFDARVTVHKDGESAAGTSLMDLMMLGAGKGSMVLLEADGAQASEALEALAGLIADRFGEGA